MQAVDYPGEYTTFLKQELADLDRNGFFDQSRGDATVYLGALGQLAYGLMGLREIDANDLKEIRSSLP